MKAILWTVTTFLLLSLGTLLIGSFLLNHTGAIANLTAFLQSKPSQLFVWRYLLLSTLVVFWPYVVKATGQYCHWQPELIESLKSKRLFVLAFFISFELVAAQHNLSLPFNV